MSQRIIIVGGPRRGKSTLANDLALGYRLYPGTHAARTSSAPIRCGDPLSKVKEPRDGVEYLPEGIPISGDDGAAQWVADNWFTLPGPWVCEGWVMARALRRWASMHWDERHGRVLRAPADRIIVLDRPAWVESSKGQEAMHRAVMTVWNSIAHNFQTITKER